MKILKILSYLFAMVWIGLLIGLLSGYKPNNFIIGCAFWLSALASLSILNNHK